MADQLNMGGLSLGESQHANGIGGRSAYIPPHLRGVNGAPTGPPPGMDGPAPPMMNGGMNGSAWGGPPARYEMIHLVVLLLALPSLVVALVNWY